MFELTYYCGKFIEYPIGKLLFPQFVPDMFLRVEFRRVGRQSHQVDVFWAPQFLGLVGTGPIHHHENEVIRVSRTDLFQKAAHPLGVHLPADHPIHLALKRTYRAVDMHELALVAIGDGRSGWRGRPTSANAHHTAKARFVLKHQPDLAPPHFLWNQQGTQRFGEFFSQSSWIWRSLFG